jgi:SepF-like predicted cell division protein (DUF552 family)
MALSLKKILGKEETSDDYLEIDVSSGKESKKKITVRPFVLKQYEDINDILGALREGYTIAVIDIKTLRSKDVIELKRSIAKIKKTVEAMDGSIAGFGENVIIATPEFAEVHRTVGASSPSGKAEKDSIELY